MCRFRRLMQKADLTSRAVAGFVDLLLIIGLARLPDVLGFLSALGYILIRDGLFQGRSVGKKLIGLGVVAGDGQGVAATYRESIIRNIPFAAAYILFLIPYAGWVLGPLALAIECLVAVGDDRGMRIGDMLARSCVVQPGRGAAEDAGQEPQPPRQTDPPSEPAGKQETAERNA
jgi:uncharacterized RDD family membrane protein YckC